MSRTSQELITLRTEVTARLTQGHEEVRDALGQTRNEISQTVNTGLVEIRQELRALRSEISLARTEATNARRELAAVREALETARADNASDRAALHDLVARTLEGPGADRDRGASSVADPSPTNPQSTPPPDPDAPQELEPDNLWTAPADPPPADDDATDDAVPLPHERSAAGTGNGEPSPTHDDAGGHDGLLTAAAGISEATLECHRDAWAFIVEQAAAHDHFRLPGIAAVVDGSQLTTVTLSGRSLIATLMALDHAKTSGRSDPGSRALAGTLYQRIADVVTTVSADHNGNGRTKIVVDDRPEPIGADTGAP